MVRCHCQSTSAHNCCECMGITREAQQVWPAPGDTPEVDVLPEELDKPLWHVTTSLARHPQFPQFSIGQGSVMRLYNHHMFALHLWSLKAGGFKGVVCMRNHNACTIQGLMHSPLQQGTVTLVRHNFGSWGFASSPEISCYSCKICGHRDRAGIKEEGCYGQGKFGNHQSSLLNM